MAAKKKVGKPKIVNVFVGRFDEELHKVAVYSTDTVQTAIDKAGYEVSEGMQVTDEAANTVDLSAKVKGGADYFVIAKHDKGSN